MSIANVQMQVALAPPDLGRLKSFIVDTLSRGMESEQTPADQRDAFVHKHLRTIYEQAHVDLPQNIQRAVFQDVIHEFVGYGPIQPLLDDPTVTEIMVNGPEERVC